MKDQRSADEPDFVVVRGAREHNLDIDELAIPSASSWCSPGCRAPEIVAGLRYPVRRGPAALRRIAVVLRAPVSRPAGKPSTTRSAGCPPTIAHRSRSRPPSNPRSTVGTVTEIYDYLRCWYRAGRRAALPSVRWEVAARSAGRDRGRIASPATKDPCDPAGAKAANRKGEFREMFEEARKAGFARARGDGVVQRLDELKALDKKKRHTVEVVWTDWPRTPASARGSMTRSRQPCALAVEPCWSR